MLFIFSKVSHYMKYIILWLLCLSFFFDNTTVFSAPYFSPNHPFPTANQSQNACYFNSINIAIEAKYGTKLRIKKVLRMIWFDGKSLATWEYKKKFSDLTHIQIKEYSTIKDLIKLLDTWESVLISTEIIWKSKKAIRHVSVAYSYDTAGIWVSDPLWGKKKRIAWDEVFQKDGKVKYYHLRTVWVKPYAQWNTPSLWREKKEDIWIHEQSIQ